MLDNTGNTESDDDNGFPALIEHARLMGWLCLIGFVGFASYLAWGPK